MGGGGRGGTVVVSIIEDAAGSSEKNTSLYAAKKESKKSAKEESKAHKRLKLLTSLIRPDRKTEPAADEGAGGIASAGSGGGAGGGVGGDIGPGKGQGDPRLSHIWQKVNRSKYYPWLARKNGWEGTPRVRFVIGLEGQINDVRLVESCGIEELDQAAIETVRRSAPLPFFPKAITLAIRFSLSD